MKIETGAPSKNSDNALSPSRHVDPQLSLPLDADPRNEYALRAAWRRSGLRIPFHVALQSRPLAISLSCLAEAMRRKACKSNYDADDAQGANRMSQ